MLNIFGYLRFCQLNPCRTSKNMGQEPSRKVLLFLVISNKPKGNGPSSIQNVLLYSFIRDTKTLYNHQSEYCKKKMNMARTSSRWCYALLKWGIILRPSLERSSPLISLKDIYRVAISPWSSLLE